MLAQAETLGLVDVNLHLGRWPWRRVRYDDTAALAGFLKSKGVTQAWAAHFDGLLNEDLRRVNDEAVAECRKHGVGLLRPVGVVHPLLPAWRSDFERCVNVHQMKVIRLYPGYHGYTLKDTAFEEVLGAAADAGVLVQVVAQLEDQRTQHPAMQVAPVDFTPLAEIMKRHPKARVMVLNANAAMIQRALRGCQNVWLDTGMIEGVAGVEQLFKLWREDRICFGSHAPVFYWEAAELKLQESDLTAAQLAALRHGNLAALI